MTLMTPREIAEIVADNILDEHFWFPTKAKWRSVRDAVLQAIVHSRLEEEAEERSSHER